MCMLQLYLCIYCLDLISFISYVTLLFFIGLFKMAVKFGLTAEQFGENMRDNYQRNEPVQYQQEPLEAAEEFISKLVQCYSLIYTHSLLVLNG